MSSGFQWFRYARTWVFWVGCVASVLLFSQASIAHEIRPTVADLAFDQSGASITLRINLEAIISEIGSEHDDTDNSPSAQYYNSLRALDSTELENAFSDYAETFLANIEILSDKEQELASQIIDLSIPAVGDVSIARDSLLKLHILLSNDVNSLSVSWVSDYGELILRAGNEADENEFNEYLLAGETSELIAVSGPVSNSWISTFKNYFVVGFVHIVPKGLDHILFVIGLFLLSPYWRAIFLQVTAFTVAHTITLAMGMTGLLQISASIVEPLIALSIAVVCLENIFTTNLKRWRLAIVVLFGLLHGLGFAGVLSEIGFSADKFIVSLLSFNLGVEAGQLVVIFVCFLFAGWPFRHMSWYRKSLSIPASVVLSIIGTVWFFQRIAN